MNIATYRLRRRPGLTAALAVAGAASQLVFASSSATGSPTAPLLAGFEARSYAPGQVAVLDIGGGADEPRHAPDLPGRRLRHARPGGRTGLGQAHVRQAGDGAAAGAPPGGKRALARPRPPRLELAQRRLRRPPDLGRATPTTRRSSSARRRLGTAPVLVVEPTNTWHAYDDVDGDSWYLDPAVHAIDLTHPFAASRVNGKPVPAGLPEQFQRFDVGFLRWYWHSGYQADFISDDDLEHISSARQLSHYRLIVFAGHEEYVTSHTFDLITALPQRRRQPRVPLGEQLLLQGQGLGEHDGRPHAVARPRPARGGARRRAVRRLERGPLSEPAVPHHRTPRPRPGCSRARASTTAAASATTGSRSTSRTPPRPRTRTSSP